MGTPSIRQAGLTVITFTLLAKIIGFGKEMIVAAHFGTSQIMDVYLAGITIPAMIGTILTRALPNAFIPLFSAKRERSRARTRVALSLVAILSLVAGALWFLAEPAASLVNRGFSAIAQAETVIILKIVAAVIVFITGEALMRSRLLAQKRFVYSSIAVFWPSLMMIGAIILYPTGGARTLAWGYFAGALMAALWNSIPFFFPRTQPPQAEQAGSSAGLPVNEGYWILSVILLSSTGGLYTLLDRYLASFLDVGSIAALQYANLVASQPVAICGIAVGMAVFPYLAEAIAESDFPAAGQIIDRAVRWVLIGCVPVAVWIGFFSNEIISLLFERGQFDLHSRMATGALLAPHGFWLVTAALAAVLFRVYYASFRWRPILIAVIGGLVIKTALSFWWVEDFGARGLVAATVTAAALTVSVLFYALPREYTAGAWPGWIRLTLALAGLSAVGVIAGIYSPSLLSVDGWRMQAILRVAVGVLGSLGLIFMLGPRLHIDEMSRLQELISGRLLRR